MSDEQNTSIEQLEQNTPDESTPSNLPTEPEKLPDPQASLKAYGLVNVFNPATGMYEQYTKEQAEVRKQQLQEFVNSLEQSET